MHLTSIEMEQALIEADLVGDYGDQTGWACIAWKDRKVNGHFEQHFFRWPQEKEQAVAAVTRLSNDGACVWKPTALLVEDRRAQAIPSNILSFEVDQPLGDEAKELLKDVRPTILRSGRPKHYHIKVYLDTALPHDENAYWTRYLASAMGISGRADSGGKFNPHDLLRIAGTRNTKPDVNKKVVLVGTGRRRTLPFDRLRAILASYPTPDAERLALDHIAREDIPEDRIPDVVRRRLREPVGDDRSEQTYAFVQLCREEGLSPGYTFDLACYHEPTRERNNHDERRIEQDVIRCWNKGDRTAHEVEDAIFATPELQFLYQEAKRRKTSPTSALGMALIHAGLAVPPWMLLPAIIGGSGSPVNLIIANVGPSGAGKGITGSPILAVDPSYRIEDNHPDAVLYQTFEDASEPQAPSSGPAFASMFVQLQKVLNAEGKPTGKEETVQYAYSRHVHWGEIDTLNTYLSDRRDTVSPELRSGWSGENLGSTTKARENRIRATRNTYRMMVSFDAQPERCGDLFAQMSGGLLSRVVFLNAWDKNREKRIGRFEPETRKMALPPHWPASGLFQVDDEIWTIISDDADEGKYVGTEDSHRNLNRLRIAALLAVMHGSVRVEKGWWNIAGAILEHSDQVKQEIRRSLKEVDRSTQRSLGVKTAVQEMAREGAKTEVRERTKQRILDILEDGPSKPGKIRQKMSKYQQSVFYSVLDEMRDEGQIQAENGIISQI